MNAEDVLVILPVKNAVLFPGVVLPIAVSGAAALAAAQEAVRTQRSRAADGDRQHHAGEQHRVLDG